MLAGLEQAVIGSDQFIAPVADDAAEALVHGRDGALEVGGADDGMLVQCFKPGALHQLVRHHGPPSAGGDLRSLRLLRQVARKVFASSRGCDGLAAPEPLGGERLLLGGTRTQGDHRERPALPPARSAQYAGGRRRIIKCTTGQNDNIRVEAIGVGFALRHRGHKLQQQRPGPEGPWPISATIRVQAADEDSGDALVFWLPSRRMAHGCSSPFRRSICDKRDR